MKSGNLITMCCAMFLVCCTKDIVVTDITKLSVIINSPVDKLITSTNPVTFWWEPLDGADKYQLQVVKPSFDSVSQLLVDTSVIGNKLGVVLMPGHYQWRLRAINSVYKTDFRQFDLTMDSTDALTNQLVLALAPLSGLVTREKVHNFTWSPLSTATNYSLEISLNSVIVNHTVTPLTSYTYSLPISSAGNYTCSWRVKAINATSISQFNSPQTFTIDLQPPTAVSNPTSPLANTIVKDTAQLRWDIAGFPSTQFDSLFIYSDAGFLTTVRTATTNASKMRISSISPANPLPAGTGSATPKQYWWRLKSVDNVGNTTGFSNSLNFQLIQ